MADFVKNFTFESELGSFGGYSGSGSVFNNSLYFYDIYNTTTGVFENYNVSMITEIAADYWNYNSPTVMQGNLGLAPNGTLMMNETYGEQFLLEIGQIWDQSFAGGYFYDIYPEITVGNGDYTYLWYYDPADTMTIPWGTPTYFDSFYFGSITSWLYENTYPSTGYFIEIQGENY